MKILILQESDWVKRGPHQQHHLMERLQKKGHQVRVVDYEIDWRKKPQHSLLRKRVEFLANGKTQVDCSIDIVRPGIIEMPLLDYLSIPFTHGAEIYKQLRNFDPDLTMGLGILNTYVAMRISKRYGLPFAYYLIDSLHTLIPQKTFRPLGKFLEQRILEQANLTFVINKQLEQYAIEMGANPKKVLVLGAGVDSEKFNTRVSGRRLRRKLGISENEIVLLFMGWLYTFSGIKEVAYSLLNWESTPKIKLLVIGRGDLYEQLLKLKENGLQHKLILIDWQPYEKVPEFVAASDICLLPAYNNDIMRDIVPIKMYEYAACGKPIIATRLPGILKEFGEDNNVIYVNRPEDVLPTAIRLSKDKENTKRMKLRASQFGLQHSWENITDQFEMALKQLLKS